MSPLAAGSQLARYRIVRPLGAGAMGEVYLAEDPQIDRQLAIKTVRIEEGKAGEVEERKRRLLREARAAGRLLHPNIVALFDAGEDQGVLFLAFEYVAGADLAKRMEQGPPLTLGEALGLVRQAADGLDFAHQQGIVHRDIKPSNLLINRTGQLKIADFGIARMTDQTSELTMTGSVVGSPHYLSPEQIRGEELDGRSDVFSLGVVLYELLSRRRPFNGETLTTLVYQILHQEPNALVLRRPDLTPRLESLVRRMLAKDRNQRFASAREVVTEISRLERELDPTLLTAPAAPSDDPEEMQATMRMPSGGGTGAYAPPPPPAGAPPPPQPLASVAPPTSATQSGGRRTGLIVGLAIAAVVLLVGGGLVGRAWLSGRPSPPEAGQPGGPAVEPPTLPTGTPTEVPPPHAVVIERPTPPTFGGVATTTPTEPTAEPTATPTATPRVRPTATAPTPAPTAEPTATPEPTAERIEVDREIESGMVLSFQVTPGDTMVRVDARVIGEAQEWNATKKEGRAYQLPDPGEHIVRLIKDGVKTVVIRVKAQEGRGGVTTIVHTMGSRASGPSVSQEAKRRLRVSEGVNLKIDPDGAEVAVDGQPLGTARDFRGTFGRKSLQLAGGEHRVVISAPGYVALELVVEVSPSAPDRKQTVEAKLARQ